MRPTVVDLNEDLKRLWDKGFDLEVKHDKYLVVHGVPYLSTSGKVLFGTLVTTLELAGDKTVNPVQDHVAFFAGEEPADENGNPLPHIINRLGNHELSPGVIVNFQFSSKPRDTPDNKYPDYYQKLARYVSILMSAAHKHDATVTATKLRVFIPTEPNAVFRYADTNSSRAEIDMITEKLRGHKIAIVGLGGTGSYLLDLVAKTPVGEIHLFDGDHFRNHNAFRAPGAASMDTLREHWKKVNYLQSVYSNMHTHVYAHDYYLTAANVAELAEFNFVFVCVDASDEKKAIVDYLTGQKIFFIDVGIGVINSNNELSGQVRTTLVTPQTTEDVQGRIPFKTAVDNQYNRNIQIADLNALNACLAVIKWKKILMFYSDMGEEFQSVYNIRTNKIINESHTD